MGGLTRLQGVTIEGMGSNLAESVGGTSGEAAKSVTDAVGAEAKKAFGSLFGGDKD